MSILVSILIFSGKQLKPDVPALKPLIQELMAKLDQELDN
jgi:hypothetical protein